MYQLRWRRDCKPSFSVTSAADMALGKSCLLQNTRRTASRSSSSFNMRCNSSRASPTRSLRIKVQTTAPNAKPSQTRPHARAAAGRRGARKAPVVAVNNKDKALRVLIVVAPQGADLVLATHIPNSEADVLVPDRETSNKKKSNTSPATPASYSEHTHSTVSTLKPMVGIVVTCNAEQGASAARAHRGSKATYNFTELELVQDGGLAGSVEPNHQNSHFLFGKQTLEQALEGTHLEESGSSRCFFSLSRSEFSCKIRLNVLIVVSCSAISSCKHVGCNVHCIDQCSEQPIARPTRAAQHASAGAKPPRAPASGGSEKTRWEALGRRSAMMDMMDQA